MYNFLIQSMDWLWAMAVMAYFHTLDIIISPYKIVLIDQIPFHTHIYAFCLYVLSGYYNVYCHITCVLKVWHIFPMW